MRAILFALIALSCTWTEPAHAFSDSAKFEMPTTLGGGGGRFFTGSPPDGYGCIVCHSGGPKPNVAISGLPEGGFQPGTTYDISVTFDQLEVSHAIALEFVTEAGTAAGAVAFAETAEADPAMHCDQDLTLSFAPYMVSAHGRTIVGLSDCGAAALRFRFTAPEATRVAFALGMVTSNGQADTFGDGSLQITKVLNRIGTGGGTTRGASSCSVDHDHGSKTPGFWLVCGFLMVALSCRHRLRRCLPGISIACLLLATGCARVAPYERGTLARRDMELGENADLAAGEEHAVAYREGSSGGGAAKGGGCGCN